MGSFERGQPSHNPVSVFGQRVREFSVEGRERAARAAAGALSGRQDEMALAGSGSRKFLRILAVNAKRRGVVALAFALNRRGQPVPAGWPH